MAESNKVNHKKTTRHVSLLQNKQAHNKRRSWQSNCKHDYDRQQSVNETECQRNDNRNDHRKQTYEHQTKKLAKQLQTTTKAMWLGLADAEKISERTRTFRNFVLFLRAVVHRSIAQSSLSRASAACCTACCFELLCCH